MQEFSGSRADGRRQLRGESGLDRHNGEYSGGVDSLRNRRQVLLCREHASEFTASARICAHPCCLTAQKNSLPDQHGKSKTV